MDTKTPSTGITYLRSRSSLIVENLTVMIVFYQFFCQS